MAAMDTVMVMAADMVIGSTDMAMAGAEVCFHGAKLLTLIRTLPIHLTHTRILTTVAMYTQYLPPFLAFIQHSYRKQLEKASFNKEAFCFHYRLAK
jgi:hypothetical protein